ncbi:MAG: hypothetical protein JWN03_5833 [Nocardia sp.]|nr:hypothetical protein [Nocardia sp.]
MQVQFHGCCCGGAVATGDGVVDQLVAAQGRAPAEFGAVREGSGAAGPVGGHGAQGHQQGVLRGVCQQGVELDIQAQ